MDKSQAIAMAMPLVSFPFMELLMNTIESLPEPERKKLADLFKNNIKTAPGTSCYTITKGDKQVEMFISLEDKDFDITENMKEAVMFMGFNGKEYSDFLNHAGQLITFVVIYYEAISERVPDIFTKMKKLMKPTAEDAYESVFVTADRKMYIDPRSTKRLCVKFKHGNVEKDEKESKMSTGEKSKNKKESKMSTEEKSKMSTEEKSKMSTEEKSKMSTGEKSKNRKEENQKEENANQSAGENNNHTGENNNQHTGETIEKKDSSFEG